jgi:hypothetical protein
MKGHLQSGWGRVLIGVFAVWLFSLSLTAEAQQRRKPWGRNPFQFLDKRGVEAEPSPLVPLPEKEGIPGEGEHIPLGEEGLPPGEGAGLLEEEKKFEPDISVIVVTGDVRAAVINGRHYLPGDELEDHQVVDIQKDYVLFRKGKELKKFELK